MRQAAEIEATRLADEEAERVRLAEAERLRLIQEVSNYVTYLIQL